MSPHCIVSLNSHCRVPLQHECGRSCFVKTRWQPHRETKAPHQGPADRTDITGHLLQDSNLTIGPEGDTAAAILSQLTSRIEEERSTMGAFTGLEAESRNVPGGALKQWTGRLLGTRMTRNSSSMCSQGSPLPLLQQSSNR